MNLPFEQQDPQLYASMIAAYVRNLAQLPTYAHRSWWRDLSEQTAKLIAQHLRSLEKLEKTGHHAHQFMLKCAQALLAMAGAALPNLAAFAGPQGKIGTLSHDEAIRFLRMRAIAFRRTEVRHCIDKASRTRLYAWVAAQTLDHLMLLPGSPQLEILARSFDMRPLAQVSAEDLEWEGLCLLKRDGLWEESGPFIHLRMRFARDRAPLPWVRATVGGDGCVDQRFDPEGGSAVFALLAPTPTSV